MQEDLALDLSRKPRPKLLSSWVEASQGVDPFKVRWFHLNNVLLLRRLHKYLSYTHAFPLPLSPSPSPTHTHPHPS
jgi:hypothetical protein